MRIPGSEHRSTRQATDTLDAAARMARDSGLMVRVVLERAPGVASQLREVAAGERVDLSIELTALGVIGYFGARPGD